MMYTTLNHAPHTTTDTFSNVELSARLAAIQAARRTPMAHWQSGDLEANGIRLHYTRTGGAKPPLVLTHGFSDDGLCWTPVAVALEAEYDVIMVDARGHGRSEGPEQDYGHDAHAADVAGLITGLQLQ